MFLHRIEGIFAFGLSGTWLQEFITIRVCNCHMVSTSVFQVWNCDYYRVYSAYVHVDHTVSHLILQSGYHNIIMAVAHSYCYELLMALTTKREVACFEVHLCKKDRNGLPSIYSHAVGTFGCAHPLRIPCPCSGRTLPEMNLKAWWCHTK